MKMVELLPLKVPILLNMYFIVFLDFVRYIAKYFLCRFSKALSCFYTSALACDVVGNIVLFLSAGA